VIQGDIMVKIQLDLSKKEDQIVEVYKLTKQLKTKSEAIKQMICYFEVDIRPKNINSKEYFK
jgi:flavoprotein